MNRNDQEMTKEQVLESAVWLCEVAEEQVPGAGVMQRVFPQK